MSVTDESRAKCIQYQEEIDKLQKEIDDYKNNLEVKEKLVDESENRRVNYFYNCKMNDFLRTVVIRVD